MKTEIERDTVQKALEALDTVARELGADWLRPEFSEADNTATALREALAAPQPAKCWKCGDADPLFQVACNVPACGMREALAAPQPVQPKIDRDTITVNLLRHAGLDKHKARECADLVLLMLASAPQPQPVQPQGPIAETVEEAARDVAKCLNERDGRGLDLRHVAMLVNRAQQPAQQEPAAIVKWQLGGSLVAHLVGDVQEGDLLYPGPQPAPQQDPDALHLAAMDLASNWVLRIAELETEVALFRANAMTEKAARQALEQQLAARAPLTHGEIVDLCDGALTTWEQVKVARAIEAAHGITKGSQ